VRLVPDENLDPEAVERLAGRLQDFADGLSQREGAILLAMIHLTMPPLERMRRRSEREVLSEEERAILRRVQADER